MSEDLNQNHNQQKSESSSEELPKKAKKGGSLLNKLIATLAVSTVCYVGFSFLNCNFMVPGSMERADALGGLKNPPPLDCKESERRGYDALFTLFTALLGLKAKMDDD